QHTAGHDAVAPLLDAAPVAAGRAHLLVWVAAAPHAVLAPDVTEGVDMRGLIAVIEEAVKIGGAADVPLPPANPHEVLDRLGIVGARCLGNVAAERDGLARLRQLERR